MQAITKEYLQQYFHADYKGADSLLNDILVPLFGDYEKHLYEITNEADILVKAQTAHILKIDYIALLSGMGLDIKVFDVTLDDHCHIQRARKGIQHLVRQFVDRFEGAFIVFHYANPQGRSWRLSYLEKRPDGQSTSPKRYTYLCGKNDPCRTIAERFYKLYQLQEQGKDLTPQTLEDAFSVEALSNEFFEKYRTLYADFVQFVTGKRFVKVSGNKWEEKQMGEPDEVFYATFEHNDKRVRDYVKKMMGRLVFLCFLQRKGWLGGNLNYLQDLFYNSAKQDDFLDQVLEPLFFGLLNTRPEERRHFFAQKAWDISLIPNADQIPYLNGGLFEVEDNDKLPSVFPAEMFRSLFDFFAEYNFTIDENDPFDAEVGVDPEMLGKIFENLLEDNKDKGAFYTPKEIVQYMCRESLIAYLTTTAQENLKTSHCEDSIPAYEKIEEAVRDLLLTPEKIVPKMNKRQLEEFGNTLRDVRICDPTIGSGAFPMGLLNELVHLRANIGAWAIDEDGKLLEDNYSELKKDIINHNIYGVDIEQGAIDIARLRFWLSIVVDAQKPEPLPNFDYKFMCGNSLIPTFQGKYINLETEKHSAHAHIQLMHKEKEKLIVLKRKFYHASGEEKLRLNIQIKDSILQLISIRMGFEFRSWVENQDTQSTLFPEQNTPLTMQEIVAQLPSEKQHIVNVSKQLRERLHNESLSLIDRANTDIRFFDWRMMFTEVFDRPSKQGFDIVIGNPPYIQLQNKGGELGKLYQSCGFESFASTGDIYCLFYERGHQLLKNGGHLCYITSNKWMRTGYGDKLRKFLVEQTNPQLLIDFAGVKVFESATVDTNILLFEKTGKQATSASKPTLCCSMAQLSRRDLKNMSLYIQQHSSEYTFSGSDSWVILSPIEQSIKRKIEAVGTPLKDWDIQINYGIKTGFNDAFIISTEKRDEILANCHTEDERQRTAELIRPILRGRDIKRYGYDWAGLWLIATFPSRHYNIEEYPAVKNYLLTFGMERLEQTGKTHIVNDEHIKARKRTNNKWFETQDSIGYWDDFNKPKIVYGQFQDSAEYSFAEAGVFLSSNEYMLITHQYSSKCLLAFLNSTASEWLLGNITGNLGGHAKIGQKSNFLKLAVAQVGDDLQTQFDMIVDNILALKKENKDSRILEKQIDTMIYAIYGLNNEEIQFIEKE